MPIIGTLATIVSLLIIGLGLPAQIYKNYKRKSCEGLSAWLFLMAFASYFLWCAYGWTKPDLFLKIAHTPGVALSLILLYQFFLYRNRRT